MIAENEIKKIARLAKLSIDEDGFETLSGDFVSIVEFVNQISALQIDGSSFPVQNDGAALRRDEAAPSLPQELILQNAHERQDGFFVADTKGSSNEND